MAPKKLTAQYSALEKEKTPSELKAHWLEVSQIAQPILDAMDDHGCFPDPENVTTLCNIADHILSYLEVTSPRHDGDDLDLEVCKGG